MAAKFLIIGAILLVISISLHKSSDKAEENFANRPTVITNPEKDLFINQKYAIVKLLAYIQGASPESAYNDEANRIIQSTISSLGLSMSEVEKVLKCSMSYDPEREVDHIVRSLNEIRDRKYLYTIYQKCIKVAEISGDRETIEYTKDVFMELKVI